MRNVINWKDDVITPNYDWKKLESDQQHQPNIFVLQALLKKLHKGENSPHSPLPFW